MDQERIHSWNITNYIYSLLDKEISKDDDLFCVFTAYMQGLELHDNIAPWRQFTYYGNKYHYKFVDYYRRVMTRHMPELRQTHGDDVTNIANFMPEETWNYMIGLTNNLTTKLRNKDASSEPYNYLAGRMIQWLKDHNYISDEIKNGEYYREMYPQLTAKL